MCYNNLSEDPYYLLNYSINLQQRGDERSLKNAIKLIQYAEGFFHYRHHKFIHRRAVLNFAMAKIFYENEIKELITTNFYIHEAEELFKIKLLLDPCSSYSYYDYIEFIMWLLKNKKLTDDEHLRRKLQIEDLLELAERTVFDNLDKIINLKSKYVSSFHNQNESEYVDELLNYYSDENFRPYALILLYNFYFEKSDHENCSKYLSEMEYHSHNDEVSKFLFKIYGRTTHNADIRKKFFELERKHDEFRLENSLRFNYLMFIANCYSDCFDAAFNYLNNVKYISFNPEYCSNWLNDNGELKQFEGIVYTNRRKTLKVKIVDSQQKYLFEKGQYNLKEGDKVQISLKFYLYGIRASLIKLNR